MRNALKTVALLAALAAGTSGAGLAQTAISICPAGSILSNGTCQPAPARMNSGPANTASTAPAYGSSSPPIAGVDPPHPSHSQFS